MFDSLFKKKPSTSAHDKMAAAKKEREELIQTGKVTKILLMPAVFGGEDIPQNTLWVSHSCAQKKSEIDQKIIEAVQKGLNVSYDVRPRYDDSIKVSYIPVELEIIATDKADFTIHEKILCTV